MTLQLRSLQHPNLLLPLGASPVRIGRGSENELVISEASVSRHHAQIWFEGGRPVVSDLGSTRGTFVNGVRVQREYLRPGDVIAFGDQRWQVVGAVAAPPPVAQTPARPRPAGRNRLSGLGCLAVVGLFVCVGVGLAVVGGAYQSSQTASRPPTWCRFSIN